MQPQPLEKISNELIDGAFANESATPSRLFTPDALWPTNSAEAAFRILTHLFDVRLGQFQKVIPHRLFDAPSLSARHAR